MELSSTSKYAIRVLTFMAFNEKELYTAKQLVEKLKISDKFLRKIMTKLAKAGLIKSIQGRNGGYIFAKKTEEIFIIDIINAVEDINKYMGCLLGFETCSDDNPCALHKQWAGIRNQIINMYKNTSLKKITENKISKL